MDARKWTAVLRSRINEQGVNTQIEKTEMDQILEIIKQAQESGSPDQDCRVLIELVRSYSQLQKQKSLAPGAVVEKPVNKPVNGGASGASSSPVAFNAEQLNLLRCQIMAFRHISKNQQVPPQLQQALTALSPDNKKATNHPQPAVATLPGQMIIDSVIDKHQESRSHGVDSAVVEPFGQLKNVAQYSLQRLIIPSVTPQGIDPLALAQERERRIRNRVCFRIAQLEQSPATIDDDSAKVKSLIELKSLRLLEKQKKLRADVVSGMQNLSLLQTASSRADYRRLKKPTLREIKHTEKMERQNRMEREKKQKQKQNEHLTAIIQHGRDMLSERRALSSKQTKLGRAILAWHTNSEKEEQKLKERVAKERIKALKEDDEEAYMKLIDKQKDTRLTHLLQQTNQYLSALTSLVSAQQNDIGHGEVPAVSAEPLPEMEVPDEDGDKIDYYHIAHRVEEPVAAQPSILTGGQLKDYQLKGLEWMVSLYNNKLNGILADEMGLGKTIQTISLITYLIEKKNQTGPFLVLVPLSTITNWSLEFEKWAPSVVKVVYKGTQNQRRAIQMTEMRHNNFNVFLTTYEYVIKDKALLAKIKWVYTIIDEGHRMKNASSKLSITLCQFYSSRFRLILTGTPLQNSLPELWALLNFVLPRIFNSVKTFDEWFNTPFANTGERIELNEEEQLLIIKRLHKVLRPFLLRRLKKDVESDLPDKTERVLKTPLSSLQQKLYNQVRKSGAMMISATPESGKSHGVRSINNTVMQLRKICNHPYVFPEVEDVMNPQSVTDFNIVRVSGKFELLDRILPKLKDTGHRVLIFFQMTAVMDIMEDYFRWRSYNYLRLDGSTKTEERSEMLKLFNAPDSEYFVFILSTRAGGLGLNLQTADTVIIFDSDWNPHQDLQAQDRAHRIGQTKEVRIFRLITANSVEETILARAQYKLEIDGKVIQAGKFDNKSTNEERDSFLRSLFDVNPEEQNDINDVDDDDELNEILARGEDEYEIFRTMDKERHQQDLKVWRSIGRTGEPKRLMALNELPDIYLHDSVPEKKADLADDFGRGQRQRGEVLYADGLSDDRWARAIDNEEDVGALIEKKRTRGKKSLGTQEDVDVVEADELTANDSEEDVAPRKKSKTTPKDVKPLMTDSLKAIREHKIEEEDGDRYMADIFEELPSKEDYPDYYELITEPISLKEIEERVDQSHYKNIAEFRKDLRKMFDNAKTFNEEGSMVYEDAVELQQLVDTILNDK